MSKSLKKVGLVLGGGGAKAFAHLGVIDVLNENNIPIDLIVACSGGSFLGTFASNKISSKKVKNEFYTTLNKSKWFFPRVSRKGLLSQKNIKNIIDVLCGNIKVNQCKIK